ncbi:hypothetical protein BDF19DRAFT_443989 [Syncephalis fuscata]|nr:hypothetical protein BDF19DRAFT_443989 [Syncephalis fuscata]
MSNKRHTQVGKYGSSMSNKKDTPSHPVNVNSNGNTNNIPSSSLTSSATAFMSVVATSGTQHSLNVTFPNTHSPTTVQELQETAIPKTQYLANLNRWDEDVRCRWLLIGLKDEYLYWVINKLEAFDQDPNKFTCGNYSHNIYERRDLDFREVTRNKGETFSEFLSRVSDLGVRAYASDEEILCQFRCSISPELSMVLSSYKARGSAVETVYLYSFKGR